MPKEIVLPELAESVVEGEIQRWLVAVGDRVEADQPIVEVMTDKATVELPSPWAGTVHRLVAAEGQVVQVHSVIAVLLEPDEAAPGPETRSEEPPPAAHGSLFSASTERSIVKNPFLAARRLRVTPAARKIARDRGVDLESVAGSGPHGRIRVADVEAAAGRARGSSGLAPISYRSPAGYEHLEERVPVRGIRRVIADQMTASHLHAVRTLVVDEADVTRLGTLRKRLNREAADDRVRLTYLPFICRALATALERYPALNASFDEATQEIVLKRYCHLGIAVATDGGLVVPVIRDAGTKPLHRLAVEIDDLATRAREGRLLPADLGGSSFTITSIGNVGTLFTFPIIHLPNAAILGVHTIKRRPVVIEENGRETIAARDIVYLSLSFDHRIIDGATAAEFLRMVIAELEDPGEPV